MFIEILLITLLGITLGIITGLIPGVHVNLISVLLVSLAGILTQIPVLYLAIAIIAMAITHTFLDTIPSTFLGAPDSDTALSVLPSHRLLLEGKGFEAVTLTLIGSLFGLVISLLFVPLLLKAVTFLYPYIRLVIGYLLLSVSIFLIWREKSSRIWALFIFLLSGILGYVILNGHIFKEPLFPLFSGMFGISMLLLSLNSKTNIPKQIYSIEKIPKKQGFFAIFSSFVAGWICSFMPGLGPSQAAILASSVVKLEERYFLVLVGGLSTVNVVLSFVTLYTLSKARNGAVVAVSQLLSIDFHTFLIILMVSMIAGGLATILGILLTKQFAKIITKINYTYLCLGIIIFITILVTVLSGYLGLFILLVATAVGVIPQLKGIGKNHMMGCLLLPVTLFFLL